MDRHRTIEPQSVKFARFVRDQHSLSPAGLNLALVLLAKYAGFASAGTERPPLIDHGLIWQWRGGDALLRNEMDGKSQSVAAEFAPSQSGSAPSIRGRRGTMIQRESLPSAPPAGDRFPAIEPHAALRSAISSETTPFEVSRGPGFQWAVERFPVSAPPLRETTRLAPTASAAREVFSPPALAWRKTPSPVRTSAESHHPHSVASIHRWARSRFDDTATAMGEDADHGVPSGQRGFVSPALGGIPVLEMAANHPNLAAAAQDSIATRFAISSQTAPWRLGEGSKRLDDFRWRKPSLIQTWAPKPLHAEFFWRDIRVNPLGHPRSVAQSVNSESAATISAPRLDLGLQLPNTPVASDSAFSAVASSPQRALLEADEVMAKSTKSETRPPAPPQILSIPEVADKVYRLLERRLVIERERRGVFRT